jgi:hypothetical protein
LTAGKIVLLIFAILFVIISIVLIIGGGFILAFDTGFKDSQGYYSTGSIPIESNSSAIITYPADFQNDSDVYWEDQFPLSFRVEASNTVSDKPIFIGIASESDLANYLEGVSYDKFEGFNSHPYKVHLNQIKGNKLPLEPSKQTFWVASAEGTGDQTLNWDVRNGNYSLILMNADGSSPIDARVALGVKIPAVLKGIGIGLLTGGIILLIIGGVMIYFSIHKRRVI